MVKMGVKKKAKLSQAAGNDSRV